MHKFSIFLIISRVGESPLRGKARGFQDRAWGTVNSAESTRLSVTRQSPMAGPFHRRPVLHNSVLPSRGLWRERQRKHRD